ncbi:MAG: response regulator [Polyangiales bacterium]
MQDERDRRVAFENRLAELKQKMEAGLCVRAEALREALSRLLAGDESARKVLKMESHKLRGIAGSYGHDALTELAAELETRASLSPAPHVAELTLQLAEHAEQVGRRSMTTQSDARVSREVSEVLPTPPPPPPRNTPTAGAQLPPSAASSSRHERAQRRAAGDDPYATRDLRVGAARGRVSYTPPPPTREPSAPFTPRRASYTPPRGTTLPPIAGRSVPPAASRSVPPAASSRGGPPSRGGSVPLNETVPVPTMPPGGRRASFTPRPSAAPKRRVSSDRIAAVRGTIFGAHGGPLRVLAMDDDAMTMRLLNLTLREVGGFDAVVVTAAADALRLLRERVFDIVISDAMMPDMNGQEFCLAARKLGGYAAEVPIVILSAATKDELEWHTGLPGPVVWLRKPFIPTMLVQDIARVAKAHPLNPQR